MGFARTGSAAAAGTRASSTSARHRGHPRDTGDIRATPGRLPYRRTIPVCKQVRERYPRPAVQSPRSSHRSPRDRSPDRHDDRPAQAPSPPCTGRRAVRTARAVVDPRGLHADGRCRWVHGRGLLIISAHAVRAAEQPGPARHRPCRPGAWRRRRRMRLRPVIPSIPAVGRRRRCDPRTLGQIDTGSGRRPFRRLEPGIPRLVTARSRPSPKRLIARCPDRPRPHNR